MDILMYQEQSSSVFRYFAANDSNEETLRPLWISMGILQLEIPGGRAGVRYVITKFYRMDSLPNFITHGAPLARFARESSATTMCSPVQKYKFRYKNKSFGTEKYFLKKLEKTSRYSIYDIVNYLDYTTLNTTLHLYTTPCITI